MGLGRWAGARSKTLQAVAGDAIRRFLAELLSGRADLVLRKVTLVGGWRMDLGLF